MVGERVTLAAQALVVRLIFPEPANHPAVHPAARRKLVKRLFFIRFSTLKGGWNLAGKGQLEHDTDFLMSFAVFLARCFYWEAGF
jgi:hypothetical protein